MVRNFRYNFVHRNYFEKKFDKKFLRKSLNLKTINQGGVPSEITIIKFFIRIAKIKLFYRFTKQMMKLLKFGKNYNFF